MKSAFPGFPPEALQFFRGLARHNNREWFQPRKPAFDEFVKAPMLALVEAVNAALRSFAPDHVTEPARAVYRIYRDTRFSKDKTPYKDHIAASFSNRVLTLPGAGYYFSVSHKEVAFGGGIYMPPPETLRAVRAHIAENHQAFRRIIGNPSARKLYGEIQGDRLSRVPKGYPPGHPAADLLRFKQCLFYIELPPGMATTPDLLPAIVRSFRAVRPLVEFLNAPLPRRKPAAIDPRELF